MTKDDILELGRMAGKLEGKEFFDAFQPSARGNDWCLKFDGADVDVTLRPGEYNASERILEEIRQHLAKSQGRRS